LPTRERLRGLDDVDTARPLLIVLCWGRTGWGRTGWGRTVWDGLVGTDWLVRATGAAHRTE